MASKPQYPIYIISKGRAFNPLTAKNLELSGLDYFIAVESQEKNDYVKALGEKRVLVLPFSNFLTKPIYIITTKVLVKFH